MEIKTTRNGPFSIRLMHPLHGVKQPTQLYELTFLPLPLPSPLSHYSPQIKFHEWIRRISKFGRDIFHIYIYINLEYRKQRLQIFDSIHSSAYPYFLLELYLGISIRSEEARGIGYSWESRERFREDRKHVVNKTGQEDISLLRK